MIQLIRNEKMLRNYIGLSTTYHDPSISIVNSKGHVVFAEGLERYLQHKRAQQCVADNLLYIRDLIEEHCEPGADIVVAQTWSREHLKELSSLKVRFSQKISKFFLPPQFNNYMQFVLNSHRASMKMAGSNIPMAIHHDFSTYMDRDKSSTKIFNRYYNHHLTHAATGCFSSSFDSAACLIVDGMGEHSSLGYFKYENGIVTPIKHAMKRSFASLGIFYGLLSEALGFDMITGEEWKLMGLAPYGKMDQEIYKWLRPIIEVKNGKLVQSKDYFKILKQLTVVSRKKGESAYDYRDLAFTGHQIFCEIFQDLVNAMYDLYPSENLVVAGGCGLNSSWMGRLLEKSKFKNLFVPSAPADDGNAIGAALLAYQEDNPEWRAEKKIQTPYTGAFMRPLTIERLKSFGRFRSSLPKNKMIYERTAELLAEGKIVGWVQGRAEFGPRSLGNRSILADPRSQLVKDLINSKVKFREEFRPFAPSVLDEYGDQYFENYQCSPYMDRALKFRPEVRYLVPGVVHVDGTGRLQTVKKEWNEPYYNLIDSFRKITGIPILLNTSFNVMGKPIVHSVEDCLSVFLTSGLDVLVINNDLYEKDKLFSHNELISSVEILDNCHA